MHPTRPASWLRQHLCLALAALVVASALTGSMAPAASAAPLPPAGTIIGGASGRCIDVGGNDERPGAGLILFDCHGRANQTWTFTAAGELQIFGQAMCLDVARQSTVSPAGVETYPCNGGGNQKWKVNADRTITGVQSGLCLDAKAKGTDNNTTIEAYTCNGGTNQKWLTAAGSPDTTPPTTPGKPAVADLTCNSLTFGWDASSDDVAVAFYDVYHDGQQMKTVSGATRSTSLTVVPGVTWGLYVNARDASGNVSQASATVPVTAPQCQVDTTRPTAPTAVTGSVSGTTVNLSWHAATDNVSVRAYDVYRGGTKVGTVSGTATTAPATTFIDSGLSARTAYAYFVVARDGQGNVSDHSSTVSLTTGASCANPVCSVTQVATDTDIPWGLATLSDGTVLYNRRDDHDIIHLNPVTGAKTNLGSVPNVSGTDGEGGLLGLALSPTFTTDHWLYLMHSSATDNRVVRIKLENDKLTTGSEQVLLTGILRNKYHNGGRLRFGPDGKLYASTGDALNGANAQSKAGLNGKILRLNPDGTVPSDNPFGNYVWSYGHRNPQGIAFDSQGRLWEQEFGNSVMDETNLITKGGNYGWPSCEGTTGNCGTAGFIAPKHTYPTSEGSCSGITIVRDVVYIACERGERLYREVISGSSLTSVQSYFTGTYGRLRTVEPAPDGGLWLTTSNGGDKDSTQDNTDAKILHVALGD